MLRFNHKLQAQRGGLQALPARDCSLGAAKVLGIGRFAVDEPVELGGWFGPARGAVDVHGVADLVTTLAAGDLGFLFGKGCKKSGMVECVSEKSCKFLCAKACQALVFLYRTTLKETATC